MFTSTCEQSKHIHQSYRETNWPLWEEVSSCRPYSIELHISHHRGTTSCQGGSRLSFGGTGVG